MDDHKRIVTIDGPSGGGKSTVSRALAQALDFTYLDTGAMYRAVAFACREKGVGLEDSTRLTFLLESIHLELLPPATGDDDVRVLLDGREVGQILRTAEMGLLASRFSAHPTVRLVLTRLQQRIGAGGRIVAEGRDTGTVVFPEAAWKFYLDASPEVRARRRAMQLRNKGEVVDEQRLLEQIVKRDKEDRERTIAPLRMAPGALYIDSSHLPAQKVIRMMYERVATISCGSGK
ncbi:(d)CMP kinase [Desulfobulbus alkaliphilus]|uniref:(d)CMP kinase n=1 Tax=Desulfobulbus alkaliphilus TaxID=869814 RepID=UPI0019648EDF|nr:(d)CMP kinase [Desulfobulbus alkaliphilus]MBM9536771.1 (d)CMP kinase [Desulfobulbus alkaliphilus]